MLRLKAKRRRPFRAALLTATLLAIVIAYFNAHPIALSTENARAEGTLESSTGSQDVDVLVVLWGHQIAHSSESRDYDAIDKSWAWVETVRREIGPVAVIEPDELTQRLLERYHVVVVTHSAAVHDQMDSQVHIFEHFVSHGGTLILERPQGAMRTAFSADGLGGTRTPTQVTAANGVTDDVAEALRQVPLRTKFIGSTGPLEGSETLLSMDGAPVLYRLERSGGHVVTVDFDYGAALYNLMQGCPSGEGFAVRDSQSPPSVDRLVCDDRLRQSEVPFADLLAHYVIQVAVGDTTPVVGVWPFPDGAEGVVLVSHEVGDGERHAVWMPEHEETIGAQSTLFFAYSASPSEVERERLALLGSSAAVLYELDSAESIGSRRRIGFLGIQPFFRQVSLVEHMERIREVHEGADLPVSGARTRGGLWSESFYDYPQMLAAAGARYDASYGTAEVHRQQSFPGYLHGTGRPF